MGRFPAVELLSSELGMTVDIFKVVLGFVVVLLLSPFFRALRTTSSRNIFSIAVGSLVLFFIIEQWAFFLLGGVTLTYLLMLMWPRPFLVSAVCATLLVLVVHVHRLMFPSKQWKVDCSAYIMFIATKLTYFGKWFDHQKDRKELSFMNYLSYNLFFPSISGPTFSYEIYLNFISSPPKNTFKTLNLRKALEPLLVGIPMSIITLYFMQTFPSTWVLENQFYLASPLLTKLLILIPLGIFYRSKFYAAWYLGQTFVNLSGLSQTSAGEYDLVKAIDVRFELQPNPKLKTEYWNSSIQAWLKNVVYDSIAAKTNSTLALFGTFFISACWHGLYLTYYLCFIQWAVVNHITKWCYKCSLSLPKDVTNSKLFTLLTWFTTISLLNTIGMVVVILDWEAAVCFYRDLSFAPLVVLGVLLGLSLTVRPPAKKVKVQTAA